MEYRVIKVEKSGNGRIETNVPFPKSIQFYLENPVQDGFEYRVYQGSRRIPPSRQEENIKACASCHTLLRDKRRTYCPKCSQEAREDHQRMHLRTHQKDAFDTPPRLCSICHTPLSGHQLKFCRIHSEENRRQRANRHSRDSHRRSMRPERTQEDWEIIKRKRAIRQTRPPLGTMKYHPFYGDPDHEEKMKDWRRKQCRLGQKRRKHPGVYFCFWCEQAIPDEVIHKGKKKKGSPPPRCCCREHDIELRKWLGTYKILSLHGNHAQQVYKAEHGEVPGYEQRKTALQRPDRTNTRRKKTEE